MAFASAVPEIAGVLSDVMSSVLDVPVSLAASKSGTLRVAGEVVSTVTASAVEATLVLPAASVAVAEMLCVPSLNVGDVKDQFPVPSAVVLPSEVAPAKTSIAALASDVPLKVGVSSAVMLSEFEEPESLAASKSGSLGAAGALVSMVTASEDEATLVLPEASVAAAEKL